MRIFIPNKTDFFSCVLLVLFILPFQLIYPAWNYKGVCYDANWENSASWYGTEKAEKQLNNLSKLGINALSFTPIAYQYHINRPKIRFRKEMDSGMIKDIRVAQKMGFKIILKPHIWSDQFREESGRGRESITMKTKRDWKTWFKNYEEMIIFFAKKAEELKVDLFVVGLEYKLSTEKHQKNWRRIITAVKTVYTGPITYASHDFKEAEKIQFWDQLDYIGINGYFSLSTTKDPSLSELKKSWWTHRHRLKKLSLQWEKNIILTEIGYSSMDGTAKMPYKGAHSKRKNDENEQADCYEAMFTVLKDAPWLEGFFIWKYKIGVTPASLSQEPSEAYFVFQNKIAEDIIRKYLSNDSLK